MLRLARPDGMPATRPQRVTTIARQPALSSGALRISAHFRLGAISAALVIFAACLSNSSGPEGVVPVAGNWNYTAQQSSGGIGNSTGTMALTSESLTAYSGTMDVLETVVGSTSRRIAGPISGRLVSGTSVDFDVTLGAVHRQHIGMLAGDTIAGSWFEMGAGGGVSAGGTYKAVRTR